MTEHNILVIDDESSVRDAFMMALEDSDYIVDGADCGEVGVTKFKQKGYSLVYLDLKMPGMNGVETLRELRKLNKAVPIYFVTAFSREFMSELLEAKSEGLNFEILQKPLGAQQIIEATTDILQISNNDLPLQNSYRLKIFVAGVSPQTQAEIVEFKTLLKQHFKEEFKTVIVDILEHPEEAIEHNVFMTPTLIKELPAPIKKMLIDFKNQNKIKFIMESVLSDDKSPGIK